MQEIAVFWFRRDLRLFDNVGLHQALQSGLPVMPLFIFDRNILDELPRKDARVHFIHQQVVAMNEELQEKGTRLQVEYGEPLEVWKSLLERYNVKQVFTNSDYEPYARDRDAKVAELLEGQGIPFRSFKDHLLVEPGQVLKDDGTPYTVFTPFSKRWRAVLTEADLRSFPSALESRNWFKQEAQEPISLAAMGFEPTDIRFPGKTVSDELLKEYKQKRDYPAVHGTSKLSVHLRFGTISIRQLAQQALDVSDTYLNELIWREFYAHILWHFPQVVHESFQKKYDSIPWRNSEADFERWCRGETGFPMVDAGMRQLNATGYMHNRVRMVVASFLCKHLLIDWRWGEAYFAEKLLDYELASNNGGWQWAAGTGTDAAPYFRIFSPDSQFKRFDPEGKYVLRWVPEYGTPAYPRPMIDQSFGRNRAIETFANVAKMVV